VTERLLRAGLAGGPSVGGIVYVPSPHWRQTGPNPDPRVTPTVAAAHLDSTRTREKSNEIGLICLRVARMFAKPKGEPGGVTSTDTGSDHTALFGGPYGCR